MLEPRIVAMSVSRFAEAVAPVEMGGAEAANGATLRLGPRAAGHAARLGTALGDDGAAAVNAQKGRRPSKRSRSTRSDHALDDATKRNLW